jgi:hypothetical protein
MGKKQPREGWSPCKTHVQNVSLHSDDSDKDTGQELALPVLVEG